MKKALSLILCLLMVFGSFSGVITASAEETNLWADISSDDFGTKDTASCPISDFAQGTNTYGTKFDVKGAYYTSFYIEMPQLEANSIYALSFKYDNYIIEGKTASIRSVSVVTEEEMAAITDVDGTVLPSTVTVIGSSLALDKGEYTDLSATYTTGKTQTKHYLYFVTNYAYWLYLCDFSLIKTGVVEPNTNVLKYTAAADWGAKSWSSVANSTVTCEGGNGLLVSSAMHQKIFTVVKLEPNTAYDFSFNWKAILSANHGSAVYPSEIYVYPTSRTGDIMNAERESGASANSGKWDTNSVFHPVSGELTDEDNLLTKAVDRATNREVALKAEWANLSTEFVTSDDTEYAILIHFNCNGTNDNNKIHLSDFNLSPTVFYNVEVLGGTANVTSAKKGTEVTITATPTASEIFNYWEVTSGGIAVADMFSKTTTFTMPAEDVSIKASYINNLWSDISADDWLTRQVGTKVDDPLTLEEKKMTDLYPENFTYGDGSFSLEPAGSKHYYIKLPVVATNKEYKISVDYSVTKLNDTSTPTLYKAIIMPESGFTNQYTWNGYGEMYSDRSWLGAYDIYLKKSLSSNELSGTISYEFNSKAKTQYYLFLMFNNIGSVTYSNFCLNEIPLNGISVSGGSADVALAKKGAEVTITAKEPESGMVFDRWEVQSGSVTLADPYSVTTTFTMGGSPVSINAVYREYGAKIVYVNTDGTPYPDASNLVTTKAKITQNENGTETVTINYDKMDGINTFIGWYSGETLVESGEAYTYNPNEVDISEVTAKLLCRNVLTGAASFESYANDTNMRVEPVATGVAPYEDKWGLTVSSAYEQENIGFYIKAVGETSTTYYTDIGYDRETGTYYAEADRKTAKYTATPHSGNSMLAFSSSYRSFTRKMEGLKPNTSYTISMYVMNPDEYNFLSSVVVSDNYSIKPSYLSVMSNRFVANSQKQASANIYGFYEEPRTEELFETNVTVTDKSSVRNWKKISFTFKTTDNTDKVYLTLYPRNRNSWYNRCQTYIDDLVCYENAIDYAGNAMRVASAELPQALRYKFSVKNEMLTSYEGYSFKELGILAVDSNKLSGAQLYKGNEFAKDVKVSADNYQYVDGDNDNTYFTAALYNIGKTNGSIDYDKYATEYAVRPYFVYTDDSWNETIIYGDTQVVSIFDVMYAIRDWPKSDEDLNAVNQILENADIKAKYCDWQPADGWNIENENAPAEYDYSFAVIGDVQYTTENYPDKLHYIYDWLIDNEDAKNLQYVFGLGDISNMSTDKEYEAIDAQLQRLKEAGINQSVIRGNHDTIASYDKYITTEKYSYGGDFQSYDGTMKTYYRKVTVGGIKYMMLTLDFFPCTAEIEWAREVIDANPDYNVIISTHGYLDDNMTLLQEDELYDVEDRVDSEGNALGGHAGQYIYDNLVVPCSNVVMVICGHEFSEGPEIKTLTREDGTTAVQMLVDFQQAEYLDLRSYGMIAMLHFSNGGETVTVEWFSSIKNEYYMDKYQFSFDLNVIK